jgi:acetyltransferase-like isoleucine patch superfamily enzyme
VLFRQLKGKIKIGGPIKMGMIKIGFRYVGAIDEKNYRTILEIDGDLEFLGDCRIGSGSKICIMKDGHLCIEKEVHITGGNTIVFNKEVVFGDNCLIAWENLIMDTDFHKIINSNGKIINEERIKRFQLEIMFGLDADVQY